MCPRHCHPSTAIRTQLKMFPPTSPPHHSTSASLRLYAIALASGPSELPCTIHEHRLFQDQTRVCITPSKKSFLTDSFPFIRYLHALEIFYEMSLSPNDHAITFDSGCFTLVSPIKLSVSQRHGLSLHLASTLQRVFGGRCTHSPPRQMSVR